MSSTSAPLKEFLIILPDHPNALGKRLAVRPAHLKAIGPDVESGLVTFGGATMSKHPGEGEAPDMIGSVMLMQADSEETVRERVKNDAYVQGGVWDYDRVQIIPFQTAVRKAL